jgi:hypothetical protein
MFEHTRIYYRNKFLHIGHIQTLYYNNDIARLHNGTCYAIIDDRQDHDRADDIRADFEYLGLTNTKLVSVNKYQKKIYAYTKKLMDTGKVIILGPKGELKSWEQLNCPTVMFQMRLLVAPDRYTNIGYTRDINGQLCVVLIFDYIIKIMDAILEITDIISTATDGTDCDVKDSCIATFFENKDLRYHCLDTYHIEGFKYTKKNWPITDEHNPHLLTIKGLHNRHIPSVILYAFYLHSCQLGSIKISFIDQLLKTYLYDNSHKIFGVIDPLKVTLNDWKPRTTEFICTQDNRHVPLSNIVYIDKSSFGLDVSKLSKDRICRLRHGPVIKCIDVELSTKGPVSLQAEYTNETINSTNINSINWISNVYGQEPIRVCYYLYNWFYTGSNMIAEPRVTFGYIEPIAFQNISNIFQLERVGYFIYDQVLSQKEHIPTFIRISKI